MLAAIQEMAAWLQDFRFRRKVLRWTRQKLEAQRSQRFRKLIQFVARHSPYYRQLFSDHHLSPDTVQLREIPPLTKQLLIDNFDRIVTTPALRTDRMTEFLHRNPAPCALLDNKYYIIRTSGTSGTPALMAYSIREWIRGCSLQIRQTPGLQWRRRIAFVGATTGHYAGISLSLTGRRGINRLFFDCRAMDHNQPVDALVAELNSFQPEILSGYANFHAALVQQAIRGRLKIRPRYILSSGEPLRPQLRELLEQTYQTTVIDLYCASESLLLAGGSTADGLMLYEEDNYFEIAADHWLTTNVFNRTVPLIRYRVNDVLQPCAPLRSDLPFGWIKSVDGRAEQAFELVNNDGDLEPVGPLQILYMPMPPVPGLQLVVTDPRNLIFRILLPAQAPPFQREQLLRSVRSSIGVWLTGKQMDRYVRFQVVGLDELEVDPRSGKAKAIIRPSVTAAAFRAA